MSTKIALAEAAIRVELQEVNLQSSNFRNRMHAEIEAHNTAALRLRLARMRNALSRIEDQLEIVTTEEA